jgi:hypothetical protein
VHFYNSGILAILSEENIHLSIWGHIMANKQEQAQETNEVVETTETTIASPVVKRERRVATKIVLPEGESTVGKISLQIVGRAEPFVHEVDFNTVSTSVLRAAALAGIAAKFATVFAGEKTPEGIIAAVEKEIAVLATGEFTSRTLRAKVQDLPDIVVAWMLATNADSSDAVVIAKYLSSWNSRDDEGKSMIINNVAVITKLEELQGERRLAKKIKNAVVTELEVL